MIKLIKKITKFKGICECTTCSKEYVCNIYDAKKSYVGDLCDECKDIVSNMDELTQEKLNHVFNYNEETGELRLSVRTRRKDKGEIVTYNHNEGYLQVSIGKKEYLAHRIIWFMKQGNWPEQIDHINHNRKDNSWNNLREVQSRANQLNTTISKNNTSGFNGVRKVPSGKYYAYIMVNRKQIGLGTYDKFDDACAAREKANQLYGFHVNHGV